MRSYIFIIKINLTKKKKINNHSEQPGISCHKYKYYWAYQKTIKILIFLKILSQCFL